MLFILGLIGKFVAALPKDGQKPLAITAKADGAQGPGSNEIRTHSEARERQAASDSATEAFGGDERAATQARPGPSAEARER